MLSHSVVAASFPRSFGSIPANLQCSKASHGLRADSYWTAASASKRAEHDKNKCLLCSNPSTSYIPPKSAIWPDILRRSRRRIRNDVRLVTDATAAFGSKVMKAAARMPDVRTRHRSIDVAASHCERLSALSPSLFQTDRLSTYSLSVTGCCCVRTAALRH
jgi:hypothetical protein